MISSGDNLELRSDEVPVLDTDMAERKQLRGNGS